MRWKKFKSNFRWFAGIFWLIVLVRVIYEFKKLSAFRFKQDVIPTQSKAVSPNENSSANHADYIAKSQRVGKNYTLPIEGGIRKKDYSGNNGDVDSYINDENFLGVNKTAEGGEIIHINNGLDDNSDEDESDENNLAGKNQTAPIKDGRTKKEYSDDDDDDDDDRDINDENFLGVDEKVEEEKIIPINNSLDDNDDEDDEKNLAGKNYGIPIKNVNRIEEHGDNNDDNRHSNDENFLGANEKAEEKNIISIDNGFDDNDDEDESDENNLAFDPTRDLTGSFENCTSSEQESRQSVGNQTYHLHHPDSESLTISCEILKYRAPMKTFKSSTYPIIVGILSNAGDSGPVRRQTIRKTWANNKQRVFFLVAGPWDGISSEYERYGDLIWIDEKEVYNRKHSVLTKKTLAFMAILHTMSVTIPDMKYSYAFKTDDDSYVDIGGLHDILLANKTHHPDYWGHCAEEMQEPNRAAEKKWSISLQEYPQPFFPRYCQGAGYAMSRRFIDCASGIDDHIAHFSSLPFEDATVGMLSERCHIVPTTNYKVVKLHRYTSQVAKKRISLGESLDDLPPAPPACMTGNVVQHRIFSELDMMDHYKTVLDPSYCNVTKREYDVKMKAISKKQEWNKLGWKTRKDKNFDQVSKGSSVTDDDTNGNDLDFVTG